jgi:hypothetical protein
LHLSAVPVKVPLESRVAEVELTNEINDGRDTSNVSLTEMGRGSVLVINALTVPLTETGRGSSGNCTCMGSVLVMRVFIEPSELTPK